MKVLFFATAACLVLSLSSSEQEKKKANFSDQYCIPYCTRHCADVSAGRSQPANPGVKVEDSPGFRQRCVSHCVPMCRELGH